MASPSIPKPSPFYLLALFLLALGFYAMLLAALAIYAYLLFLLVMATPDLLTHVNFATARFSIILLGGAYLGLIVFGVSIVRGIFVRSNSGAAGIRAHRAYHQNLFTLAREVAGKVGAHVIDEIWLSPGSEVGVWEESGVFVLPGRGKQKLLVGMAALSGLTSEQLRAVFAHEFGHIRSKDTFLPRFISRAHQSHSEVLSEMSRISWWWLNPIVWILGLYMLVYSLVNAGFHRQAELRADALAVESVGPQSFANAMANVVVMSNLYGEFSGPYLIDSAQTHSLGGNAYTPMLLAWKATERQHPEILRKLLGQDMATKHGAFDHHPSVATRLRRINVPTSNLAVSPCPRLIPTPELERQTPDELRDAVTTGPPSAAEELLGKHAVNLQEELTRIQIGLIRQVVAAHHQAVRETRQWREPWE